MLLQADSPRPWYDGPAGLVAAVALFLTSCAVLWAYGARFGKWCWKSAKAIHRMSERADAFAQLQEIFEADEVLSPEMKFTMDAEGGCEYISPSFLAHFNWTTRELINNNWEGIIGEESYASVLQKWDRAYKTGKDYQNDQIIIHRDNTRSLCRVRAVPIKDTSGKVKKFRGRIDILTVLPRPRAGN